MENSTLDNKYQSQICNVSFGDNCTVVEPVNIYDCSVGDNSFIGPFVEVQKGVKIGSNTKVQSHTFVCELVTIGDNCFIGHGVMFVNDLFEKGGPACGDQSRWKGTLIHNNVSIGSNCTILPVEICEGTVIGAGAVVTKDIKIKGIYAGNPAKLFREL
jgi:acetyltransferase-like isoleucine patch superfamily enzyme